MSAKEFSLQIEKEWAGVEGDLADLVAEIGMHALRGVVMKSPVDTGRFKGNWLVSTGTPDSTTTDVTDKNGGATIAKGEAALSAYPDTLPVVILQNNLPYAERLENGWSSQAPAGMVALTVAEINAAYEGKDV